MHDTADKLVASFWGKENFQKYIKLDKENSRYFGIKSNMKSSFNSNPNFNPNSFKFKYNVFHSAFHGDTARIEFTLDSTGKLEIFFQPKGLYQPGNLDSLKTISQKEAIVIAKKLGLAKGKGKWTTSIEWKETDPTTLNLKPNSTLLDFIKGHFTWAVKSTLEKNYSKGCFTYKKQVYYIDIVTGNLIDKEDIND